MHLYNRQTQSDGQSKGSPIYASFCGAHAKSRTSRATSRAYTAGHTLLDYLESANAQGSLSGTGVKEAQHHQQMMLLPDDLTG